MRAPNLAIAAPCFDGGVALRTSDRWLVASRRAIDDRTCCRRFVSTAAAAAAV